jgi:hypothetical protein
MRPLAAIALVLLIAPAASAQETPADAAKRAREVAARVPFENPTKGAPYSAETNVESTQTLADGNHINHKTTGRVYRDGEGRTRREEEQTLTVKEPNGPISVLKTSISIVDPVGGFAYSLDPEHKTAWRTPIGAAGGGALAQNLEAVQKKLEMERAMQEKLARDGGGGEPAGVVVMRGRGYAVTPDTPLEHKTIEGVAVEGRKTTTTIPAGAIGNEQPITITSEEWSSPELHVLVLTRHNDPRSGESTYRLTNIVRAEPDRSLFMVPPDYTVKDSGVRKLEEARLRK